jgi:FkbM family methyltransferase
MSRHAESAAMKFVRRCIGRLRFKVSYQILPESRRTVSQVHSNSAELLVFSNEIVGRHLKYLGEYEARETSWLKSVCSEDWVYLDVGANVGYFSMLFATLSPRGVVHAFEPSELNWRMLSLSVALNGLGNVKVNKAAVSDVRGVTTFERASDGAYSSMKSTGRKPTDHVESVDTVRLDDYVVEHGISHIDCMKVDVEGAEQLVLRGASRLLASPELAPSWIFIELFEENLAAFSASAKSVFAELRALGYASFVLDKAGRTLRVDSVEEHPAEFNYLFRHPRVSAAQST